MAQRSQIARIERLEQRAQGIARMLTEPPPMLQLEYVGPDGTVAHELTHVIDPLASLKRRLLRIAQAPATPSTPAQP